MKTQTARPGTLYVTATPIGNASDITLRALDILKSVSAVACEDTRITARLLALHGIKTPLVAYHEHNAAKVRPGFVRRLKNGESMALVSDAGTPLVSDPGYRLVTACLAATVPVTTLPGASSVLGALVLSGLPSDRFLFAGFLPTRSGRRKSTLQELGTVRATLVFMESPRRLAASLSQMAEVLGARPASVSREMTKLYEETRRGSLDDLADHYKQAGAPKGEVMIVVGPPDGTGADVDDETLDELIAATLSDNSVRDAVRMVTDKTGLPRQAVYRRTLILANNKSPSQ